MTLAPLGLFYFATSIRAIIDGCAAFALFSRISLYHTLSLAKTAYK